jgi:hypothetical protein
MSGSGEKEDNRASHSENELGLLSCGTFLLIGKGNAIRPEVGVLADNDRLECVDGLRLKPPSWGSNNETVELMLGLRLNVDDDDDDEEDLLLLLFLALWYLMAAMAQTSKASALSRSGFFALVST